MGDWNIILLEHSSHKPTEQFINTLQSLNYFPLISRPTRFSEPGQRGRPSLLDNIFTNCLPKVVTGILKAKISDHLPVFAIATKFNNNKQK